MLFSAPLRPVDAVGRSQNGANNDRERGCEGGAAHAPRSYQRSGIPGSTKTHEMAMSPYQERYDSEARGRGFPP